jgi:hypothetical protein
MPSKRARVPSHTMSVRLQTAVVVAIVTTAWMFAGSGCVSQQEAQDDDTPLQRPRVRVPQPIDPGGPGQSLSVLQHYLSRDLDPQIASQHRLPSGRDLEAEAGTWTLPFKSKRMVAILMATVARDRLEDLPLVLAPDARWGKPDPRMFNARPIFGDDAGERFLAALRESASRFPHPASYVNATTFELGIQERLRTGAEPMWSYFENDLDRILFRFRVIGGRAWIDYVGLFEEFPTEPVRVADQGPAPPMSPPVRLPDGSVMSSRARSPAVRQPLTAPQ